jgi:hypothetical protein
MEQFTVTITSESSCVFKDSNRGGRFRAHLGRNLELRGNWCVALLELFYPITYGNLPSKDTRIICTTPESSEVFLPRSGFYSDGRILVDELNRVMHGHFQMRLNSMGFVALKFAPDAHLQTYTIPLPLLDILGFERFTSIRGVGEIHARYPCDTRRGFPKIFTIESDIIREQIVNNGHRKSLRSFTPSADSSVYGLSAAKSFEKLLFLPVSKNSLESIDFQIIDERQQEVSFDSGTLSAVLVFKRCGYGF